MIAGKSMVITYQEKKLFFKRQSQFVVIAKNRK